MYHCSCACTHNWQPTEPHCSSGWIRRKWRTKQGSPGSNKELWQDLQVLLQECQAPIEWIKVPLHVGLYGNETADQLADLGVQKHGVRMQGQQRQTPKRQAEWARDRSDLELESQRWAQREVTRAHRWSSRMREVACSVSCLSPTQALKISNVMKAYNIQNSSPTAQQPLPCGPRRMGTGDNQCRTCTACKGKGCSGNGTGAARAC